MYMYDQSVTSCTQTMQLDYCVVTLHLGPQLCTIQSTLFVFGLLVALMDGCLWVRVCGRGFPLLGLQCSKVKCSVGWHVLFGFMMSVWSGETVLLIVPHVWLLLVL